MFDLTQLPTYYLSHYGEEKVAEIVGLKVAVVRFWIQQSDFPLVAVQKLLDFDPAPLGEVRPLYELPNPDVKVEILLPTNRKPEPDTVEALFKLYDSRSMRFKRLGFNSLFHVRNMMAGYFLRTGTPLSYWSDDDAVPPCGDAPWYKEVTRLPDMPNAFAGLNAVHRLMASGKKMIGGSYVSRREDSVPQFAGGRSLEISELVRQGPRNQIIKRDWVGFGGVLVHRDVFLDIIKTQGAEIKADETIQKQLGYEYRFFSPLPGTDTGDDISFCERARKAGHEVFVDLAVALGHVGTKIYTYRDIRKR